MSKVYLIGNSHIDPAWLWQWQEGFAEIKATFRSALDRMKEFEHYKFTSACGAYYMWIEQIDPEMFKEIQERVKEGRWCLAGGWLIQPDCNIPCGESFAHHALITQRYFYEKFGQFAKTGYNVDSFGHNGNIPMLLKNSKMENYVFMRPMAEEKTLPQSLFVWESSDGSSVKTYRLSFRYCITQAQFETFQQIKDLNEGTDQMAFYGVGNHGGGATVEMLNQMKAELSDDYIYSTPDEFFTLQDATALPIIRDDMQFHAKGCYSAYSEIKTLNRKAETEALAAEKFSVLSQSLTGTEYPGKKLEQAWKNVLFNQFHDILGGCSIRVVYDDARLSECESLSISSKISNHALQQISRRIDTIGDFDVGTYISEADTQKIGTPLVIFNSLDREITQAVHIRKEFGSVKDAKGNNVPCQIVRAAKTNEKFKWDRAFEATVPAFGYSVYRFFNDEADSTHNPFTVTDCSVSNEKVRLTFDKNSGEICSFFDMENNKELMGAKTNLSLFDDSGNDTWAHQTTHFDKNIPIEVNAKISVTESGPVRATVRVTQSFKNSTVIRDYTLCASETAVRVSTKIDFREEFGILKFDFTANTSDGQCFCKIPFGRIKRPADKSEQVCGDWICIKDEVSGIGIATNSKHSFSANENTLSLTVLRNCLFADHYGQNYRDEFNEFTDMGEHKFEYLLFPFTSFGDTEKRSKELQNPLTIVYETFHKGELPLTFGGIDVSEDNISITAVKKHEDGNGIILRCYETDGKDTQCKIRLFDTEFNAFIPHDSVKTYLIDNGEIKEVDFIE